MELFCKNIKEENLYYIGPKAPRPESCLQKQRLKEKSVRRKDKNRVVPP